MAHGVLPLRLLGRRLASGHLRRAGAFVVKEAQMGQARARLVLATTAVGVLLAPGAAQAVTKRVGMGPPPAVQKTMQRQYTSDANAYFPKQITIHAGDSVQFVPYGFHTADIPARGKRPTPLFSPTGKPVTGAVDAAGAPFWFNGQPELGFSPPLLASAFGKTQTFNAAKGYQTGVPLQNRPKPATVTFRKPGTYKYYCDVHPGMQGSIRIVPARRAIPSKQADARRAKVQADAALRTAKALAATQAQGTTVSVGLAGAGGVEYLDFKPNAVSVPVGGTVTFTMPARSTEAHTATTGPGNPEDAKSFLGALAASFGSPVPSPAALYPSDPPPAVAALSPTTHGNGFWNSGVLDAVTASPPPSTSAVTFSQPGTYPFTCLIHPFMKATVQVS
jgi:plastocyanin